MKGISLITQNLLAIIQLFAGKQAKRQTVRAKTV